MPSTAYEPPGPRCPVFTNSASDDPAGIRQHQMSGWAYAGKVAAEAGYGSTRSDAANDGVHAAARFVPRSQDRWFVHGRVDWPGFENWSTSQESGVDSAIERARFT